MQSVIDLANKMSLTFPFNKTNELKLMDFISNN